MKQNIKLAYVIVVALLMSSTHISAQSTSWKGTGTNDFWTNAANWTNGVPDSTKDAILGDSNFTGLLQPKVNTTAYCKSITVGGNVHTTLNITRTLHVKGDFNILSNAIIDQQSATVYLKGNWANDGVYNTYANGSRIICNGATQVFSGASPSVFRRFTINAGAVVSLQTNISVTGTGSILAVYGEIDPGQSPTYKVSSTAPARIYGGGKLKINAALFTSNYEFTGSVTWYSGAIADYSSTVTDQTVSSAYSYSTLMISGSGVKSLAANLPALYSKNAPNGMIMVMGGTFDIGSFTANRGTTVAGGTLMVANGATFKMAANNFPLNFTTKTFERSGTVEYYGAAQTVSPQQYGNLSLTGTGNKTLNAAASVAGILTVANGRSFITNSNLTLKSDSAGTASVAVLPEDMSGNATAYITGAVSIERYIPARKAWRLLSAPVQSASAPTLNAAWQEGAYGNSLAPNPSPGYGVHITGGTTLNGFDQSPTNAASIKYYNNTTNTFTALPANPGTIINITNYPGYMIYIRGDRSIDLMQGVNAAITSTTLRMKGEIRTGHQTTNVNASNFSVFGNPYPAAIDFATLTRNNVKNTFYLWDPKLAGTNGLGGYVTVSWNSGTNSYDITSSVSPVSQYIPSGEAVLVESLDGINPGTIVVKEADKTTNGSDQLFGRKNPAGKSIRVNLMSTTGGENLLDAALLTYHDTHSNLVDANDARKLNGSGENIAVRRSNSLLAIERRKIIQSNDTAFLNVSQLRKQNYRLSIHVENMERDGLYAMLKDNYDATLNNTPLNMGGITNIDFVVNNDPASSSPARFSIVFVANPVVVTPSAARFEPAEEPVKTAIVGHVNASMLVYPNPVTTPIVSIRVHNMPSGNYQLQVMNSMGQVVVQKNIRYSNATSLLQVELPAGVPGGQYEIKLEGEGKKLVAPVIKQ